MASGRRSPSGRATLWLGSGLLLLALLLAGCYWWIQHPMGGPGTPVDLEVESGESARQVAQATADAGVAVSPWLLYQWFRWSGQSRQIRAGSYEIQPGTSPAQLLRKLVDGDQSLARPAPDRRLDFPPDPCRTGPYDHAAGRVRDAVRHGTHGGHAARPGCRAGTGRLRFP